MDLFIEITFIFLFSLIFLYYYFHEKNGIPTNWPIIGMLPALLVNIHNINDYYTEIIEKSQLNFVFRGPWFANMNILGTVDPANVHHIMSKNFGNYPKGSKFNEIFDVLGDGIFNSDSPLWEYHRKMAQSFLTHSNFHGNLVKKIQEKIENGLKPILNHVSNHGIEIDLQDLFGRFTFDIICNILMGFDSRSLSIELPGVPPAKALDDLEEIILYRHVIPTFIWKSLRWMNIGLEKKHKQAWKILDDFVYSSIAMKSSQNMIDIIDVEENEKNYDTNKLLRDTIVNFLIAGRDTTSTALSWFFYLVCKNPHVEIKLREELEKIMNNNETTQDDSRELCNKLVYLHASLCETLRLYPPVVFESKSPAETDILPSGHRVNPNMQIILNLYAMGRMKSIWGNDCWEFKPERWISEKGKIRHEPSYKFLAFNAGPRTCVGKDMAFTQMKIVAASILRNYRIESVEGYEVIPDISIILRMKYGFKVKVNRIEGIAKHG